MVLSFFLGSSFFFLSLLDSVTELERKRDKHKCSCLLPLDLFSVVVIQVRKEEEFPSLEDLNLKRTTRADEKKTLFFFREREREREGNTREFE